METSATTNNTASTAEAYAAYARNLASADASAKTLENENAWKAAKKVEAVFLGMLLKEMEKTVEKGSLFHGGMGEDMFQTELDNAYINSFENGQDSGIARLYYEQLMRRSPAEEAKALSTVKSGFIPLTQENAAIPLTGEAAEFLPLDSDGLAPQFLPLSPLEF
jgi:flagellar protein FlgJ